jgi:hypothetical protein
MRPGYARVSTEDQNLDGQYQRLSAAGCEKLFEEKLSGARRNRPKLEKSKETFHCFSIPPLLNEDVERDAVLVHGTPKIALHALDPNEHLIHVPFVTGPRTTAARVVGKVLAEFLAPAPNSLIGDDDAPLGQQELNIS